MARANGTALGRGVLFGIPIHVDRSWLVIAALIAWSLATDYFPFHYPGLSKITYGVMGASAAVLLFVCVLLHEIGHSLVARRHGIRVSCITLFMFGGVAQIADAPRRPAVELTIALAGPLVSLIIAVLCREVATHLVIHNRLELVVAAILRYLYMINVGILIFNLLPGFPLDGGRVLRAILWASTKSLRKATRIASAVGAGFGLALMMLGGWWIFKGEWFGGLWYVLLGWFLRNAALHSYRASAG